MKYMLDTNICIYMMKNNPKETIYNFTRHNCNDICISSITYSELKYGVEKSKARNSNMYALMLFLSSISIVDYDYRASDEYGIIRSTLEKQGNTIGQLDLLIGAHAKANNLILVTNNVKEFSRIPGLKIEDWSTC